MGSIQVSCIDCSTDTGKVITLAAAATQSSGSSLLFRARGYFQSFWLQQSASSTQFLGVNQLWGAACRSEVCSTRSISSLRRKPLSSGVIYTDRSTVIQQWAERLYSTALMSSTCPNVLHRVLTRVCVSAEFTTQSLTAAKFWNWIDDIFVSVAFSIYQQFKLNVQRFH